MLAVLTELADLHSQVKRALDLLRLLQVVDRVIDERGRCKHECRAEGVGERKVAGEGAGEGVGNGEKEEGWR